MAMNMTTYTIETLNDSNDDVKIIHKLRTILK